MNLNSSENINIFFHQMYWRILKIKINFINKKLNKGFGLKNVVIFSNNILKIKWQIEVNSFVEYVIKKYK